MAKELARPTQLSIPASGGTATHQLANPSDQKVAYKVTSTNDDYRVTPRYGFIDASEKTNIEITRQPGEATPNDKLCVQFAPAPSDAYNPQDAFEKSQPIGNIFINLVNN